MGSLIYAQCILGDKDIRYYNVRCNALGYLRDGILELLIIDFTNYVFRFLSDESKRTINKIFMPK